MRRETTPNPINKTASMLFALYNVLGVIPIMIKPELANVMIYVHLLAAMTLVGYGIYCIAKGYKKIIGITFFVWALAPIGYIVGCKMILYYIS